VHFLRDLSLALVAAALSSGAPRSDQRLKPLPDLLIGYTEFRTDLPGGRYVNVATRGAVVVNRYQIQRDLVPGPFAFPAPSHFSSHFLTWCSLPEKAVKCPSCRRLPTPEAQPFGVPDEGPTRAFAMTGDRIDGEATATGDGEQPWSCNPGMKTAVQTKKQRSTRSFGKQRKTKKNLQGRSVY
jgi:hypothetical protein